MRRSPRTDQRREGGVVQGSRQGWGAHTVRTRGFMEPETFKKLAGSDDRINPDEIRKAVETAVPESRNRLLLKVRQHSDLLTTSYDMIGETHRLAGQSLMDWIAKNYRLGKSLDVVVVCTGNSRRSMLGATMGNIAAAYYGLPEVRFHSGGTAPTAFNVRTVSTLKEIGVEVEPTGKEAARCEPNTANPVYRIRWGFPGGTGEPSPEATEFSKHYGDPTNPRA